MVHQLKGDFCSGLLAKKTTTGIGNMQKATLGFVGN
jgi:hypothetical protein